MTLLLVLIVVVVTLGAGGYAPWAALILELGAAVCAMALVLIASRSNESSERLLEEHMAWKQLPFSLRYPFLTGLYRRLLGSRPSEIEIELPDSVVPRRHTVFFGVPLKRTGLAMPLGLLTVWICLSLVPLDSGTLALVSSEAHTLRADVAHLTVATPDRAPLSLVPFLTLRDLWLWLAYLAIFYFSFWLSKPAEGLYRLTRALLVFGATLGASGIFTSLVGWRHFLGDRTAEVQLRAVAAFGNPNHYAAFLSVIFLCGLGLLASGQGGAPGDSGSSRDRWRSQEAVAKAMVEGLLLGLIGLGIVFSLSRSAITFTLLGTALFIALTRHHRQQVRSARDRGRRSALLGVSLAAVALAAWIGIGPVAGRFRELSDALAAEAGRRQVAIDSLDAARDFWVTGAGLSSYRYITSQYRTFPGRVFYSWAHNDYLQLLIELGLPGMLLLFWIIAIVIVYGRKARDALRNTPPLLRLHAGYVCAATVIALHSFTDFGLHLPAIFLMLAIVTGAILGMEPRGELGSSPLRRPSRTR